MPTYICPSTQVSVTSAATTAACRRFDDILISVLGLGPFSHRNSCGTREAHCGPGNCQEGTCDGAPIPYSTNGLCGSQNFWYECLPKFGSCCSQYGYCGNGTDYCSTGCQSGSCLSSTTATTTSPQPTQTPGSVSQDGTCGYTGGLVCTGSTFGSCCSAAGFCGSDQYHCLDILGW